MDFITLAMAKKYTDSQRLVSIERSVGVIKWDGDDTDKMSVSAIDFGFGEEWGGYKYVLLTDPAIDYPPGIKEVFWYKPNGSLLEGRYATVTKYGEDNVYFVYSEFAQKKIPSAIVVEGGDLAGLWVLVTTTGAFVGEIRGNFVETIHPIDPKYLPGVCLPRLVIEEAELMQYASAPTPATEEHVKALSIAFANEIPLVVTVRAEGVSFSNIAPLSAEADPLNTGNQALSYKTTLSGVTTMLFFLHDGEWYGAMVNA